MPSAPERQAQMKICVFSDSHGYAGTMLRAIEIHSPDMILHLGDGERDMEKVKSQFPSIPITGVRGNCDWYSLLPETEQLNVCGLNILMTHGHVYGVKSGMDKLIGAARNYGAGLVLYGHTHRPAYTVDRGLHILNPGSCQSPSGTFAVIDVSAGGDLFCRLLGL